MKRRNFIKHATYSATSLLILPRTGFRPTKSEKLERIGLTTVIFRNQFELTKTRNQELKNKLTLFEIPEYFTDRFGVHNVEIWTKHFEATSKPYLNDLKKRLRQNGCKLINLQTEGKFDPSDISEENRLKSVAEIKEWIAIASFLGSRTVRIRAMKMSYQKAVISLKEISKYAQSKGIGILVENHNDLFSNTTNHLNIIKHVPQSNLALLADFGNFEQNTRYSSLERIAPYTKLISAKTKDFNDELEHISFDYEKCVRIFEKAGYKGIYSCEQWGKNNLNYDYETITDWMIEKTMNHI